MHIGLATRNPEFWAWISCTKYNERRLDGSQEESQSQRTEAPKLQEPPWELNLQ